MNQHSAVSVASTMLAMGAATYATRVLGYLWMSHHTPGRRLRAMLEGAPGCVMVSVIAPAFVSPRPLNLIALAITIVAAARLPLLATVLIGMGSTALLRWLFGG